MNNASSLPGGYAQSDEFRQTKQQRWLNVLSFAFAVGLIVLGALWRSFDAINDLLRQGFGVYILRILPLIAAFYLTHLAHVVTHGVLLRLCSGRSAMYAWRKTTLFVGSGAYFSRGQMLAVNLLPLLLWSAVFGVCAVLLQGLSFWLVYFCFIYNFCGSLNDVYFACKILGQPTEALYQYRGYAIKVFTEENA